MTVPCEYCNKILSNKSNLKQHQKSKTCLSTRGDIDSIKGDNQCKDCEKYFFGLRNFKMHQAKCTSRLGNVIDAQQQTIVSLTREKDEMVVSLTREKDEMVESLIREKDEMVVSLTCEKDKIVSSLTREKDKIVDTLTLTISELRNELLVLKTENRIYHLDARENKGVIVDIAKQPKTTHTTNNLVLPVIDTTQEAINDAVELHYDRNHFFSGQKGVADFAKEYILVDDQKQLGYVCTDAARGVFKHLGEDGNVAKDVRAVNLTKKLARPIKVKASEIATDLTDEFRGNTEMFSTITGHFLEVSVLGDDSAKFCTRLGAITAN